MPIVKLPDGSRVKFPDTMSDVEITTAIETEILPQMSHGENAFRNPTATTPHPTGVGPPESVLQPEISPSGSPTLDAARQRMGLGTPSEAIQSAGSRIKKVRDFGMNNLPAIGSTIGGLVVGYPGATIGGAAGQGYEDFVNAMRGQPAKTEGQAIWDLGKSAAGGAVGQFAGNMINAGVSKILAPAAAKLKKGAAALYQKAIDEGLPLSPDAFTDSKITKWAIKAMDKVPPFSWGMANKRKDLIEKITQAREDFITKHLGMPDPSTMTELSALKTEAYDKATELAGGKAATVKAPALQDFLTKNIETPAIFDSKSISSKVTDALNSAHKKVSIDGTLTMKDITDLWAKKNGGGNFAKLSGEQRGFFDGLKKALESDIQGMEATTGNNVSEAMKVADQSFKTLQEAGKAKVIERIFKYSTDYDTAKEMYILKPLKLQKEIETQLPRLQKILNPEQVETLQKFSKELMAAVPDVGRLAQAKTPGVIESLTLAVPYGFTRFMTDSVMAPQGWMKKWLSVGYTTPDVIKAGIKAGTQAASQKFMPPRMPEKRK